MPETLQLSLNVTSRHWEIYKKDFFANILPTILEPIFFLLALGVGLGAYVTEMNGLSYIQFIAPGLAMSTALFTAFFETSYNFYIRLTFEGIFKAIMTSPIGPREILIGEMIWVGIKGAVMSTGVTLVLSAFGAVELQYLFIIPFIGAIVALACGAIGLIATAMVRNINQFQTVYTLLIAPMFFFSGIFYPIQNLPEWAKLLAHASPLYHGVALSQTALWGNSPWQTMPYHLGMLVGMVLVCWAIAYRKIYPKLSL